MTNVFLLAVDILALLPVGIVVALLSAGITVGVVLFRYLRKNRSASYPLNEFTNLDLTQANESFKYKNVTKVRIRSNNNRKK